MAQPGFVVGFQVPQGPLGAPTSRPQDGPHRTQASRVHSGTACSELRKQLSGGGSACSSHTVERSVWVSREEAHGECEAYSEDEAAENSEAQSRALYPIPEPR